MPGCGSKGWLEAAVLALAALEAAEIQLERRVIAREELPDALAVSAAGTTVVTDSGDERITTEVPVSTPVPASASVPGAIVPPWREGLSASVLSPDNQRILNMLQDRLGGEPVRAEDIAGALGIDDMVAAKVEEVCARTSMAVKEVVTPRDDGITTMGVIEGTSGEYP